MSRPASALNSGQTNKKFLYMALGLGALGALLVYVAFSRSDGSGRAGGGDQVPVVVAKTDIEARTRITASMVEVKLISADDASALALPDTAQVIGKTTRFPIAANEQVLSNKIVDLTATSSPTGKSLSYVIPEGMRAISVNVKDVTNAGGLLLPGDYVDVLVVYNVDFSNDPGKPSSHEKIDNYFVHTILQAVEVLAVKQTVVDAVPESVGTPAAGSSTSDPSAPRARNSEANPQPDAQTVTLALPPDKAQLLYFAEQNGKIRFAVRRYGDIAEKPVDPMIQTDLFPRNLPNPFVR
jgi:pilus assembly protein CpaB